MSTVPQLPLNFLTIGVPADDPSVPPDMRSEVASMLQRANDRFKHVNAPIVHIDVTPADQSQFIQRLTSQHVDAVVIGNGVRSNMKATYFLEQLIDIIHTKAPKCRVLFNTTPLDVVEAIQRWYPEVKVVD